MATTRPKLRHRFERVIPGAREDVWQELLAGEVEVFDCPFDSRPDPDSEWMVGEPLEFVREDDAVVATGTIIEIDEPSRLVHSYAATAAAGAEVAADDETRVEWMLDEDADENTRIVLVHEGFPGETATFRTVEEGWDAVLDRLAAHFEELSERDDEDEPVVEGGEPELADE